MQSLLKTEKSNCWHRHHHITVFDELHNVYL